MIFARSRQDQLELAGRGYGSARIGKTSHTLARMGELPLMGSLRFEAARH